MRRVLAAALLALAGPAYAQIFSESVPAWAPGMPPYFGAMDPSFLNGSSTPAMFLPLMAPGCYASPAALGSRGEAITLVRATTATYTDCAGVTQTCAANEIRVGCESGVVKGMLVERATTNAALQSSTLSTGAAATVPWTLSAATVTTTAAGCGIDGSACAEVTSSTNLGAIFQAATTASSTTFSGRARVVRASGSAIATVSLRCGGVPSVCTCFPAASCTASTGGGSANDCTAKATVAQSPIDLGVNVTCPGAITGPVLILYPGEVGVSTGVARFTMAQAETGTTPTSYVPTAGTAVARNADVASVSTPAGLAPDRWCTEVTATPFGGRAWNTAGNHILGAGTVSAANSWILYENAGVYNFSLIDAAVASKGWQFNTAGYVAGSTHRIAAFDSGGVLGGKDNGANLTVTPTGVGSGVMASWPATIYLGARSDAALPFDGYLSGFRIWRSHLCR